MRAGALQSVPHQSPHRHLHLSQEESAMKTYTLANGDHIPAFGLGTWKSSKGQVAAAVQEALAIGYKHIDFQFRIEGRAFYLIESRQIERLTTLTVQAGIHRQIDFVHFKLIFFLI